MLALLAAVTISVAPNPVDHDEAQTVKGRGWPVIEFCERKVRVRLESDQNRVALGRMRVRDDGSFRFRWTPDRKGVGPGRWRLIVKLPCESGDDGSPNPVERARRIRVR